MKYFEANVLAGFRHYKYRAIDTSPLSVYVMHPFWDWCVMFYPTWLAANTLTFLGFILVTLNFLLMCYFDWGFHTGTPGSPTFGDMPRWIWLVMFVFHFGSHTLDGTDGKQAKRTKSSSPLGELFDHGVDSLSTVFMPLALFSLFGRDHYFGGNAVDMHFVTWCILLTFALSHWEKYNTQVLYLPWGYDIALLGIAAAYVITFFGGFEFWHQNVVEGWPYVRAMKYSLYITTFGMSVPVSVINILVKWYPSNELKYSFIDGMAPLFSISILAVSATSWLFYSPNNIAAVEPRMFVWHQGVLFSSHICRVIVSQMTGTKCQWINWMMYPYMVLVGYILVTSPDLNQEISLLYGFSVLVTVAHVHFGICAVRQIASSLGVPIFSVPKSKSS